MSARTEIKRQRNQWQADQMAHADKGIQPVFVPQAAEPIVDIINSAPVLQPEMITALVQEDVRIEGVVFAYHERTMVETVAMRNAEVRASVRKTSNKLLDILQAGEAKILGATQAVDNHIGAVVYDAELISGALQLRYQTSERIEPIREETAKISEQAQRVAAPINNAINVALDNPVVRATVRVVGNVTKKLALPTAAAATVGCAGVGQEPTPIVIHVDENGIEIQPEITSTAVVAAQTERSGSFYPAGITEWMQGALGNYGILDKVVSVPPDDPFRRRTEALIRSAFGFDRDGNPIEGTFREQGVIGTPHRFEPIVLTGNPGLAESIFNRDQVVLIQIGEATPVDTHPNGTMYLYSGSTEINPTDALAHREGMLVVRPPENGHLEFKLSSDCVDPATGSQEQCTLVGINEEGKQVFYIDSETGNKVTPDPDNPTMVIISKPDDSEIYETIHANELNRPENHVLTAIVHDLSEIDNKDSVVQRMQTLYDQKEIVYSEDPSIRSLELYVALSAYDRLKTRTGDVDVWLQNHIDYLNGQLAKNELPIRVALENIVIVSDSAADGLSDPEFWNERNSFPPNLTTRFVLVSDYDPFNWIEEDGGSDNALLHELGHYALFLWDHYFEDLGVGKVEYDEIFDELPINMRYPTCNDKFLMCGGSNELSDFDVLAIKRMWELKITNWSEAYGWWVGVDGPGALDEVTDVNLSFNHPPGSIVRIYRADPSETTDVFNLHRDFTNNPVVSTNLDPNSSVMLPSSISSGYSYKEQRIDSDYPLAWGEIFLVVVDTESGHNYYHVNSHQLLTASWRSDNRAATLGLPQPNSLMVNQ